MVGGSQTIKDRPDRQGHRPSRAGVPGIPEPLTARFPPDLLEPRSLLSESQPGTIMVR